MVTKQALINGISTYIHQYVLPSITDIWSRRIMDAFADLMVKHPEYFDKFIEKYPALDMFCMDGMYDIDVIEETLIHNIDNYGSMTLSILGGKYTFDASDVRNLRNMI